MEIPPPPKKKANSQKKKGEKNQKVLYINVFLLQTCVVIPSTWEEEVCILQMDRKVTHTCGCLMLSNLTCKALKHEVYKEINPLQHLSFHAAPREAAEFLGS